MRPNTVGSRLGRPSGWAWNRHSARRARLRRLARAPVVIARHSFCLLARDFLLGTTARSGGKQDIAGDIVSPVNTSARPELLRDRLWHIAAEFVSEEFDHLISREGLKVVGHFQLTNPHWK